MKFLKSLALIGLLGLAACQTTPENVGSVDADSMMTPDSERAAVTDTVEDIDSTGVAMDDMGDTDVQGLSPMADRNAPQPGSQEQLTQSIGDRVFYDTDRHTLDQAARSLVEQQAEWLQRYPNVDVTVEGHADERGTREYNLALGERRAQAVKDYLVALGISPTRIDTVSYGKERPAVVGSNPSAWAQNRRGVIRVN